MARIWFINPYNIREWTCKFFGEEEAKDFMSDQILERKYNIGYTRASYKVANETIVITKFGNVTMNELQINIKVPDELAVGELFLYNFDAFEDSALENFKLDFAIFEDNFCDDEKTLVHAKIVDRIYDVMNDYDLNDNENIDGINFKSTDEDNDDNEDGEIV